MSRTLPDSRHLGLSAKAALLLGAFGVTLGFIVSQALTTSGKVDRTVRTIRAHDGPALARTRELMDVFDRIVAGYEDAVLLGEAALAERSREGSIKFHRVATGLEELLGRGSSVGQIVSDFDRYTEGADSLARMMLAVDGLPDDDRVADLAADVAELRTDLSQALDAAIAERESHRDAALIRLDQHVTSFSRLALWSVLPAVLVWLGAFTYVRGRVVRPLQQLSKLTARVARGDLSMEKTEIRAAHDEIGQLVRDFDAMTAGLFRTTVSKDFLDRILDSMEESLVVLGSDSRIRRVNRSAASLTDRPEAELVGAPASILGVEVEKAVADSQANPVAREADPSEPPLLEASDGTKIPVALSVSRVETEGDSQGIVLVLRDMREQITAERERQEMEHRLFQSAKLESVGQLAAGIAHEINTPTQYVTDNTRFLQDAFQDLLTPVSRCLSLTESERSNAQLTEDLGKLRSAFEACDAEYLMEEIPRAISQSLDGVTRVASIVRAMKDFSHPSNEKTTTDINRAIENTVTVASSEWKYVADLELDLDPSLAPIECLPGEFNQVILNMIVNAAHAIAAANREEKGTIRIRTRETGAGIEISISDTGKGIPEAIRHRIFDPFFTTKEVGKGTGQGLSIAHAVICQKHSGVLLVESEENVGTTFRITLPRPVATEGSCTRRESSSSTMKSTFSTD